MRICIPIRESNLEKAKKQIRKAEKAARGMKDVYLEIWLDLIQADSVIPAKAGIYPIIAVCRSPIERGNFNGSEKERIKRLENAASAGAKFVDVGIHTEPSLIKNLKKICSKKRATRPSRSEAKQLMRSKGATLLIVSKHFWNSTPSLKMLLKTYEHAKRLGADIVKIATFVKNWSDNIILFELTRRLVSDSGKVIIIGMGKKGKISRIGCQFLGSYLTYVALNEKSKTASGQFTIRHMRSMC